MRLYVSLPLSALVIALLSAIPAEAQTTDVDCVALVDSAGARVARAFPDVAYADLERPLERASRWPGRAPPKSSGAVESHCSLQQNAINNE